MPHIVDIKWRLNYTTKTSQLERVNDPQYAITLQTEVGLAVDIGRRRKREGKSLCPCSLLLHGLFTISHLPSHLDCRGGAWPD